MSSADSSAPEATGAAAEMGFGIRAGNMARAIIAAAEKRSEIVGLSADLKKYTDLGAFALRFPDRYVEIGMAEQNLVMVAAGLAQGGLVPVATTFASFLTRRAHDFTVMQVALPKANIKLVGAVPGITSTFGASHCSLDDLATMRATPGMTVIEPRDAVELGAAMTAALEFDGPVYLRAPFDRGETGTPAAFRIGPAQLLRDGADIGIVAAGIMVDAALDAAEMLAKRGISATVLATPTIKPFDEDAVAELAARTGALVTAENHAVAGGLFSAVAETLVRRGVHAIVRPVGVQDTHPPFGQVEYILRVLGMTPADIATAAEQVLKDIGR